MALSWLARTLSSAASEVGAVPVRAAAPATPPASAAPVPNPSPDRRPWLALAGVVLLHLSHPLTWQAALPGAWFAPAGIGLLLTAWLGPRGAALTGLDALLVVLVAWLRGAPPGAPSWGALVWGAVLAGPEAWLAWWVYHRLARGARRLSDPRSAILFLVLVPGAVTGLFALLRAAATGVPDPSRLAAAVWPLWAGRALGILSLAPALLVLAMPWLIRRGLATAERPGEFRGYDLPGRLDSGDVVEITGLAVGTGLLNLVLLAVGQGQAAVGWQLWVLPLLLLVWTSLRQGLRGGTAVAGVATTLALLVAVITGVGEPFVGPLQGYLLAQCSTALLVGASFSWIHASEARYRQVVERIPVVLYSARFLEPVAPRGRLPDAELTFVSVASRQVLHCPPEELLGSFTHWLDRVHAGDHEVLYAAIAQLRQLQPVTCEYRVRESAERGVRHAESKETVSIPHAALPVPHSGERWLRDTLVPTLGPDGQLEGWEGVAADITEQRALALDLRRTTGMFHTLVAHLPAGVFFVEAPSGRPIQVNARARKLLGQREDLSASLAQWPQVYRLFRPDGTLYPADELPVAVALRRGVTSMRDDIVVHRPDGRKVPLVGWAAPIDLGGHGRSDAAVWVLEDLTLLHQAEAARRESEGRLRTVIEAMAEGVLVCDRAGVLTECNPAAGAILGVRPDELRGQPLAGLGWTYLREDGTPCPTEEHPALVSLRTGQAVRDAVLGLPPDENGVRSASKAPVRWLLFNTIPLPEGRGTAPARVVVTFTDITAQRQALEAVQTSEEKYRGLVESLPLLVVQIDRDGRVTYINPATKKLAGYDLDEVRDPEVWQSFLHPEDRAAVQARLRAPEEATEPLELRWRARDGSEHVGYAVYQPRWQNGEWTGTTCLMLDLTAQRHLEQELQRSQRLELVGRLAGGIVHDFNNLLTVMLSLTEMTRASLGAGHPAQEDLRHIQEAGEQAARLAEQLLTFSKQRQVMAHRLDANAVVRYTLDLLRRTLPKEIRLEADLAPDELPVLADETQLQQVVMNLCLNGRDALLPDGGRLTVRTEARGEGVRLSVEDTGRGMSGELLARIFDPFFSTKEHGTGLGLAVVKQIVEGSGGRVEVASAPGRGARFDVWLPPPPEGSPHAPREEPASRSA
jgi:PAS domain S-box-containing protein